MAVEHEELQARLGEQAKATGATYFGVADLSKASEFVISQGGDFLHQFPYAVSVGVALADGVIDEIHQHDNAITIKVYGHHIYSYVSGRLDMIASTIASEIEREGFLAYPVPSTGACDQKRQAALISHKLVAALAGLGWIGKSSLLIAKGHGPRIRWVTVLTNAPLTSTTENANGFARCGACTLCVDLCPVNAFTGDRFDASVPVDERFNRRGCEQYLIERSQTFGSGSCGICVYVCPHGWSQKRRKSDRRTTPALLRDQLDGLSWDGPAAESQDDQQGQPVGN
ncbi:MAG: 4Fe-4S double cluster binding domain-containing protein [Arenicellales bacterium]|jgi:epoxyqueuosine reductase QueG|nr:4Fe-4S double cluster binding domain-containing protein [Arenicellales bacterium]|tara:strand:+ start:726 stop:1577 length:852 start_codon:yes stop_codon:yes gene_type:complete